MTHRRPAPVGDRGSATAEFAVALPAVLLVLMLGVGALAAGTTTVRLQDATADAARLAARGESERALAIVTDAVPDARAAISRRDDLVCVTAEAATAIVVTASASSCALAGGD